MFTLVTDSTCDLGVAELQRADVRCVPLNIQMQGRQYADWSELDPDTLYQQMKEGQQAQTVPPSVAAFMDVYQPLVQAGQQVLSIHLSSQISETITVARNAAAQLPGGDRVHHFDSGSASCQLAEYVLTAVRARDAGLTLEQTVAELERVRSEIYAEFCVTDLEYLRRGGRLSRSAELVGNLLGVRPVLGFQEGRITARRRVRASGAGQDIIRRMEQHFGQTPLSVAVVHAGRDSERMQELQAALRSSKLNIVRGRMQLMGCVIGAHVGPGTFGYLAVPTR
ncbi:DegV family protein [Deinococcus sonorensis]|uniref:DegV family protein n=2 Tax=Deinococcus sonorensis TaxID=309891 RepID=A0AAU7UAF4_9DEIO